MAKSKRSESRVPRKRAAKSAPLAATPAAATILSNCTRAGIMTALAAPGSAAHDACVWVAGATLASVEVPSRHDGALR
jgi:hypothetical protein